MYSYVLTSTTLTISFMYVYFFQLKLLTDLSMKNNELSQNFESLQTVISEGEQQREKLKKVIRKLNEDRTHYRNTSEKLK